MSTSVTENIQIADFRSILNGCLALNIMEALLLVSGLSLYKRKLQMWQGLLHICGSCFMFMMIASHANYKWIWYVMVYFSMIPFFLQLSTDVVIFWLRFIVD